MSPKKETGHTATPMSNEPMNAVNRLPCELSKISNISDIRVRINS